MAERSPLSSSKKPQSETTFTEEQRSARDSSVLRGPRPLGSVSRAASQLSLLSVSTSEVLVCKSPSLEDPDLETPCKPLKALIFQIGLPITTFSPVSPSSSAVTISTKYLGKPPPESIQSETQRQARLERLLTERLKIKPIFQHAVRTTRDAGIIRCESIQSIKQPTTIPSGTEARETRKELDQTQSEFFCVTQLTKPETKLPPPEQINLECLPILYHADYNVRFMKAMKGTKSNPFILPNKPARICALLEELLFKRHNCDCVKVEVTDFQRYTDVEDSPITPDAARKHDIIEVTKILKVKFPEEFHDPLLPTWSSFDSALLYPLRVQVNGSLQACGVAMNMGWAINIGGGFCYNSAGFSKGLAVYDDLLHCLFNLTLPGSVPGHNIEHILVINYDAYQSSSYEHIREIRRPVTILDFYFVEMSDSEEPPSQYPNKQVDYRPFKIAGKSIAAHLGVAHEIIESVIVRAEILPSLCIYIAGTNVMYGHDKQSRKFQAEHVVHRDLDVFKTVQMEYNIPIAILMGGGNEESDVGVAALSITELCKIGWRRLNINWLTEQFDLARL